MAVATFRYSGRHARHQTIAPLSFACLHSSYSTDVRQIKRPTLAGLRRGTGGRSSFNGIVATVFGATGFVGRYVVNQLAKIGTQIIIPYRGDYYDVLRLRVPGDLGQILFQPYCIRDMESIRKAVKYSDVVINLVGRDWETKNFKYDDVHVEGARAIARATREAGVEKLIHFSSLSATENPTPIILKKGSQFLASKYRGELAVREEFPDAIIFRPGAIYGREDRFIRHYAHVWRRHLQGVVLWNKGEATIKQPVFVSDVAAGVVSAVKDPELRGKIFQAVGPKRYVLADLVDWFFRAMRRCDDTYYGRYEITQRPLFLLKILFSIYCCPVSPAGYLHWEGLEKDHNTDVFVPGIPTLEDLGVTLTEMENIIPWMLRPYRRHAYYDEELGEFEKPAPPPIVT